MKVLMVVVYVGVIIQHVRAVMVNYWAEWFLTGVVTVYAWTIRNSITSVRRWNQFSHIRPRTRVQRLWLCTELVYHREWVALWKNLHLNILYRLLEVEKLLTFIIPVSTRRRFDAHTTSITLKRRCTDFKTTSCAYWDVVFGQKNMNFQNCFFIFK